MSDPERHAIAIIGGAAAGAEAAGIFAERGILTVVFEQNPRPYGKIEDGLPRWHVALRQKEYRGIDEKLTRAHVHFVPETKLGRDLSLHELTEGWGFDSVILTTGAWKDRSLPVEGADEFVGRGLIYQNPFIMWFNHKHEPGYSGEEFEILDGTIVVGGGLASIDVVKVIQLELTLAALAERGLEAELVELEVKGIPKVLAAYGLEWEDLGLEGCTLYYRRRPEDMPLVSPPPNATPAQLEKIIKSRGRVLEKARSKYLFGVEPLRAPIALIRKGDRLAGLEFAKTEVIDGRVKLLDERVSVRAPLVISSIGSIPEPIPEVPMDGELIAFKSGDLGRLPDFPTLFSAGNVVTGKGNIVDSRKHARRVAAHVRDEYLCLADALEERDPLAPEVLAGLLERVRERQGVVGYHDYKSWMEAATGGVTAS